MKILFTEHHFVTVVCAFFVLMMTISPGVFESNRPIVEDLASDLVLKPMSADQWVELVRRWLARRA